jgi:hypothetical protein
VSAPTPNHQPNTSSSPNHEARPPCFIAMEYGERAINGRGRKTYNFDKVYRVFQKAVKLAGLEPVRADEQKGGAILDDMVRALRDAPVVLADLSMDNPGVYYEVGRRHECRPEGTVLVCRKGTVVHFDLSHFRVHVYSYDGGDFDFDEAERFIEELRLALTEAKRDWEQRR